MFQRLIRAIKSMFGGLVSSMENPKLILEQNIKDLNDQIPQMNENIATVKANLIMLQKLKFSSLDQNLKLKYTKKSNKSKKIFRCRSACCCRSRLGLVKNSLDSKKK